MKKKIVKNIETKKEIKNTDANKNRVYGVIGMVALFLIGGLVGYVINGADHVNRSGMSKNDCRNIASEIVAAAKNNQPDLIEQLNKVYSMNCLERRFVQPKAKARFETIKISGTSCERIEKLLTSRLESGEDNDAESHIDNAKIYANLSERGCPENSQKYKEMAKQELEIARALNDDILKDKEDSIEIVETYKRLQMQQEAERMIEKAKKLTNPAIDFIIQLEKIIEE
ncbi:MAG: hypothetical protein II843_00640 [Alphaproteobacteria bacterium]|nr:hypothetical protein [Alphaproteobacteria bacterium]MBQ6012226.1 hypothetical protein [Alphaproteobacteria bacterium]